MSIAHYRLLNAVLLAALFAGSLAVYDRLPDPYAVQFAFDGQPTRWESRSPLSWLSIPMIAAAIAVLLEAAGWVSASRPSLWSVPDKARFLALAPAERAPIVRYLRRTMGGAVVMTTVLLGITQFALFHAATRPSSGLTGYFLPAVGGCVVATVAHGLRTNARVAVLISDAYRRRAEA